MKITKTINLEKGDWIVDMANNLTSKKGEFAVARVKGFKVEFDKTTWVDMNKNSTKELKEKGTSTIKFENSEDRIAKLNKKELKEINKLITKLKIIQGLEDGEKIQEDWEA